MSLFETNPDAATGSVQGVSQGPHLGFGDAFSAAYDAQAKGNSVLAVSTALERAEAEQARKIEALGGRAPKLSRAETLAEKQMQGFDPYGDLARTLSDGGNKRTQRLLSDADAKVEALRQQYPDAGLKTYRELFEDVKQSAQKAEKDWNSAQTTTLGAVGGFLGGALAGMDPRTDPYNFGTLPIAGGGASVAGRIAVQAGVQGATEAVNQLTGVQENRRLLGLKEESPGTSIAAAAVGGALFQGAGEAAFAAGKRLLPNSRWFRDAPNDPAPPAPVEPAQLPLPEPAAAPRMIDGVSDEQFLHSIARTNFDAFNTLLERDRAANPSVLGNTRVGRARTVLDLDYVGRSLDDWRGPLPAELRADTAARPDAPERYTFEIGPAATIDERARAVDPDTFTLFDRAKQQAETFRAQIAAADDRTVQANRGALDTVEAALETKQGQLVRSRSPKVQERLNAEIAELTQQRDSLARDTSATSAELREELVRIDHQLRDLAPVVSRAYAAAKGQMSAEADGDAARFLADLARSSPRIFPETAARAETMAAARPAPPLTPRTVVDDVPIIASRPAATAALGPNADAADKLAAVMKQVEAERDTSTDAFREQIGKLLDETAPRPPAAPAAPSEHAQLRAEIAELREGVAAPDGAQPLIPTELEDRIIQAVAANSDGGWKAVRLNVVRDALAGVPRAEVDAALRSLQSRGFGTLSQYSSPRTEREVGAAAVDFGGGPLHVVMLQEPGKRAASDGIRLVNADIRDAEARLAALGPEPPAAPAAAAAPSAEPIYRLPSGKTLHLDNDRVPSLDGTRDVSVREYLDELRQDEEALKSVSTCGKR